MHSLNLTSEEQQALMDLLECAISDLHTQILHTDRRDFKNCLKTRKQLFVDLLDGLRQQDVMAAKA